MLLGVVYLLFTILVLVGISLMSQFDDDVLGVILVKINHVAVRANLFVQEH